MVVEQMVVEQSEIIYVEIYTFKIAATNWLKELFRLQQPW